MTSPAFSRASSMKLSPSASRTSSMKSIRTGSKKSKKVKKVRYFSFVNLFPPNKFSELFLKDDYVTLDCHRQEIKLTNIPLIVIVNSMYK